MRIFFTRLLIVIIFSLTFQGAAFSDGSSKYYDKEDRMSQLGKFPYRGKMSDVLMCSGANEILWVNLKKVNPGDSVTQDAERKASWYSAVALWVYAVKTDAVVDAPTELEKHKTMKEIYHIAKQCRKPPDGWRTLRE